MTHSGERIRAEPKARGLSRRRLGQIAGLSETAISDFEHGRSKRSLSIYHLAKALNLRVEFAETGKGPKYLAADADEWADVTAYDQGISAGDGATPDEYAAAGKLKFKRTSLQRKGLHARRLEIYYARGDSMEPRIHDGDALLIDRDDITPRDGNIYAVKYAGHDYVKRLHQYGQQWFLVSENGADPKWRKPVPLEPGEDFAVLGRVRWIGSWED